MYCPILQGANIRLVVIGQSAHHHVEVSLTPLGDHSFLQCSNITE